MAPFSTSKIATFFENRLKFLQRGEAHISGGNMSVRKLAKDKDKIFGLVDPGRGSTKNKTTDVSYSVQVFFTANGPTEGSCTCPIGKKRCSHMAALLLWAQYLYSKTDFQQVWNKPSSKNQLKDSEIINLWKPKTTNAGLGSPMTVEDLDGLRVDCDAKKQFGLFFLLSPETLVNFSHLDIHNCFAILLLLRSWGYLYYVSGLGVALYFQYFVYLVLVLIARHYIYNFFFIVVWARYLIICSLVVTKPPSSPLHLRTIDEWMDDDNFSLSMNKISWLTSKIELTEAQVQNIAQQTVGQSCNPIWLKFHKFRLTASNFGFVLTKIRSHSYPPSFWKRLFGGYYIDKVQSVVYGKSHEDDGITYFEKATGKIVQQTGIHMHLSGVLGASPDGLCFKRRGL